MAIATISVTGKVLLPDGTGSPGGIIVITLSTQGSVEDDVDGTQRVAAVKAVTIASTGAVSFEIVPNDIITPASTVYRADYRLPSGYTWTEFWDIASDTDPLEIGDITQATAVVTGREASFPSAGSLPTPSAAYRGRVYYVTGGTGEADAAYICLKGSDESYTWVLTAIGG